MSRPTLLVTGESRRMADAVFEQREAGVISGSREVCVQGLFERQVAETPEAVAVAFGGEGVTYRELDERAEGVAGRLRGLGGLGGVGVGADGVVGICAERGIEAMVGVLGILKAGGAYLPLDPAYPRERLGFMLEDSGAGVLVTQGKLEGLFPEGVARVFLDAPGGEVRRQAQPPLQQLGRQQSGRRPLGRQFLEGQEGGLAYVIYTSGSTGKPKGVAMPHGALVNLLEWQRSVLPGAARTVQFASLSFDVSFQEIFSTWCSGGTLVLVSEEVRRDPAGLWDLLVSERVERLFLPFVALAQLAEAAAQSGVVPESLRDVITAGEQLRITPRIVELFERLPWCSLHNHYGPSETHVVTAYTMQGAPSTWPALPPIGKPISNTRIYLLDADMKAGVEGELHVAGESLCRGDLHRPEATAAKFVANPFEEAPSRLYKTGDLARLLPSGDIEFLGRADDQVKVRGFRIELGEVETAMRAMPGVREAAVVLRENVLAAYVVAETGAVEDARGLETALKGLLPEYMVPGHIEFLPRLPLTPSGKVDKLALPGAGRRISQRAYVAPRNAIEEAVVEIWAEVLRVERVGIEDDFFELGGHSLLATQVVSRAQRSFRVNIPVRMLYEASTPSGFSNALCQLEYLATPPPAIHRRADSLPAPLSFAQGRLWLLDRLAPGQPTYNEPFFWRLEGRLDAEALRAALGEVVRRHEVLRTLFRDEGGTPVQIVSPAGTFAMPLIDLTHLAETDREAEGERLALEEAERPFDLERGPLFRVTLLRLRETEHILLPAMHHIVCDDWSHGVLARELGALYSAFAAGKPSPLPELPIQYPDFALWQREWLKGETLDGHLAWWEERLCGELPTLDLPADRARPLAPVHRGARHSFAVPGALGRSLTEWSRKENASLFMTLLAAFQALLSRYTGEEDIVVGTPIANRTRAETEGLIGFFVNTLALRTSLAGNPTFSELLRRVRETVLGAFEHQDIPFEKVVEKILPRRETSRHPLFEVMFVLQNACNKLLELDGLRVEAMKAGNPAAKFDVTLSMTELADGSLDGMIEYSADLFDAATIERMAGHFHTLLEGIISQPDASVSELGILTGAERRALSEWNATKSEYPRGDCIHHVFERQVERAPEATALVFEESQISYGELNRRANGFADCLRKAGAGRGALVGVRMERSIEMIVCMLGILKAGGAYVPIDTGDPVARWHGQLESGGVGFLVSDRMPDGGVPEGVAWVEASAARDAGSASNPERAGDPLDLACVFFTSGSTGRPKGVAVPHRAVLRLLLGVDYVRLGPEETLLQMAPVSFDAATFELWGALLHGGRCVLFPERMPTVAALGETLRRHAVTTLWLTSSLFNLVIDEAPETLRNVRQLLAGGDALSVRHVRRALELLPGTRLINGYGPTEGTTFSCCHTIEEQPGEGARSIPIGKPISNTEVHVLDRGLNVLPVGIPGELYIGGDGLARGYLNLPELTAEKFIGNPFAEEPGARLYKTGDLARRLPDGTVEFLGRLDRQVKIRGYRIEVGEIEAALGAHPEVRESAVIAREDKAGGKYLAAYVVPNGDAALESAPLRAFLGDRLPNFMIPSAFAVLEALPLSANGKVDRKALAAFAPKYAEFEGRYVAPSTPAEKMIAEMWRDMLGCERIGVHDHFFDSGGHSLLAVRMLARLGTAMGRRIPWGTLFAHPTIQGLARAIENGEDTDAPVLVVRKEGAKAPLFFFYGNVIPGAAFCFELGKELGEDRPLYVVPPPDLCRYPVYPNLEETAKALIESVRSVKPEGPYVLGGYCYGGIVAYEAARQLEAMGERVEALILVDSPTPKRPFLRVTRRFIQRAGNFAGVSRTWQMRSFTILWNFLLRYDGWSRLRGVEKLTLFPRKFGEWLSDFPRHLRLSGEHRENSDPTADTSPLPLVRDARISFVWELAGYRALPYAGRMDLFLSEDETADGKDTAEGWKEFARRVEVHAVPGNHYGVVTSHRHVLFKRLRTCLEGS